MSTVDPTRLGKSRHFAREITPSNALTWKCSSTSTVNMCSMAEYRGAFMTRADSEGMDVVSRIARPYCSYGAIRAIRSEEHTSELQSHVNLVCRLLLEKKKKKKT